MVIFVFKMCERGRVELEIQQPEPLSVLLGRLENVQVEGLIAIRAGKVLSADTLVADGDSVDLFPAIAGG